MRLKKEISELVDAGVISEEVATNISDHYAKENPSSHSKLIIVFGILGALLIGLGIILILAHNWDELSRSVKTVITFIPLVVGQIMCAYSIWKKEGSIAWAEGSSTFLFFAVGSAIALVGQIYNIPGEPNTYVLTWLLLCLPLVYLMKSSAVSLMYIIGITYYAASTGYWDSFSPQAYRYWLLLLLVLPHYYYLFTKKSKSNATVLHHWLVPLSVTCALGMFSGDFPEWMFVAYISMFTVFALIAKSTKFEGKSLLHSGYLPIASLGIVGLLLFQSFDWFWDDFRKREFDFANLIVAPELIISVVLIIMGIILLMWIQKNQDKKRIYPIVMLSWLYLIIFLIGSVSSIASILINVLILFYGILIVRDGTRKNHFGILNYGLLIIAALVACRFFDDNISFVIRGLLFVLVGAGFFGANYFMVKKRDSDEK